MNDCKDEPSKLDQRRAWLAIAELIGVGICGILSNNFFSTDHKILGVWCSFFAIASFLVLLTTLAKGEWRKRVVWMCTTVGFLTIVSFAIWTFQLAAPGESNNLLKPSNEPTPKVMDDASIEKMKIPGHAITVSKGELTVFLGPFAISTAQTNFTVLRLYDKDVLTLSKTKDGISVSADIWNDDGKIMAVIENNEFRVNPNNVAYFKRPDRHTLVVTDERKRDVLFVHYLNPTTVKIRGVFRSQGDDAVAVVEDAVRFGPFVFGRAAALHLQGNVLFDWPGSVPENLLEKDKTNVVKLAQFDGITTTIYYDHKGRPWLGPKIGGVVNQNIVGSIQFVSH